MNSIQIHSDSAATSGSAVLMRANQYLLQAWLGSGGGTATVKVYGRMNGAPWNVAALVTFTLSGANDTAAYFLNEPWYEVYAAITAIAGGAVATVSAGY